MYCPKCGDIYRRIAWNNRGKKSTVWRCVTRVEHGPCACDAPTIQEAELHSIVVRAINQVLRGKNEMLKTLEENIVAVLALEDDDSLESIQAKLEEKQRELLKLASAHKNYDGLAEEINKLREQKQSVMVQNADREGLKIRIDEMKEFFAERVDLVEEYDENLVRRIIEKVTVYDEYLTVEFKSGISVNIRR